MLAYKNSIFLILKVQLNLNSRIKTFQSVIPERCGLLVDFVLGTRRLLGPTPVG